MPCFRHVHHADVVSIARRCRWSWMDCATCCHGNQPCATCLTSGLL